LETILDQAPHHTRVEDSQNVLPGLPTDFFGILALFVN
jgi:hypothetical protein